MTLHEHPLITSYLRRFDIAAVHVPAERREALREEIAAHLRDAIPAGASDAEVAAIITDFGSAEDIVTQEGVAPVRRSRKPVIIGVGVLVAVAISVGVGVAIVSAVSYKEPYPSPVVADPTGTARIDRGRVYQEYRAAIDRMELPLPPGAEYPTGVPFNDAVGYDEEGQLIDPLGGGSLAHNTWLCAWESEYLSALEDSNLDRQIEAEKMIMRWSETDFYLSLDDPDLSFVTNVVAPLQVGDSRGVAIDQKRSCGEAHLSPRR